MLKSRWPSLISLVVYVDVNQHWNWKSSEPCFSPDFFFRLLSVLCGFLLLVCFCRVCLRMECSFFPLVPVMVNYRVNSASYYRCLGEMCRAGVRVQYAYGPGSECLGCAASVKSANSRLAGVTACWQLKKKKPTTARVRGNKQESLSV